MWYKRVLAVEDLNGIHPSIQHANVGETVMFHCDSYTKTKWFYKNLFDEPISDYSYLLFEPVSVQNNGYYYCFGEYIYPIKQFLAKARLKVYGE